MSNQAVRRLYKKYIHRTVSTIEHLQSTNDWRTADVADVNRRPSLDDKPVQAFRAARKHMSRWAADSTAVGDNAKWLEEQDVCIIDRPERRAARGRPGEHGDA